MEALELEPVFPPPPAAATAAASAAVKTAHEAIPVNPHQRQRTDGETQQEPEDSSTLPVSYWKLLRSNPNFTLYLCSYITNHTGEWLTYLASLTALREMITPPEDDPSSSSSSSSSSSTAIALLVAVRLLTNVLAVPWGGALADAMDRRRAMILLDVAGAVIAWLFLAAVWYRSPTLIFLATFLQEIDAGLYEPSRSAIVPLLCPSDSAMETATLLTGMAWSTVAATASAAGGFLVSVLGLAGCFLVDSLTYLISAALMMGVSGNWSVATSKEIPEDAATSPSSSTAATSSSSGSSSSGSSPSAGAMDMVCQGGKYLSEASWGPLVGLKFSATWLTMDVLMVDFAARATDPNQQPLYLGALFGAVGVGCLFGPPLASHFTNLHNQPGTVQIAAVAALGWSTLGCFLISCNILGNPLWVLCLCTVIRSSGIAILWIQSSLLLQKLSSPEYLGRVSSIDFGLALVGEALSALITGRLRDAAHFTPEQVCAGLALLGVVFTTCWTVFTWRGGGAMGPYHLVALSEETVEWNEQDKTVVSPTTVSSDVSTADTV